MPTITYPTLSLGPSAQTFSLVPNTQVHMSPLSGATQTVELPGARWVGQITYDMLEDKDVRLLRAFLVQLRGRANRFNIWDFSHPIPTVSMTGSTPITTLAATPGSTSIYTSGWAINKTPILTAGDYFSLGGELKMVTVNANSGATGLATIFFEPHIRTQVAISSTVTVATPKVLCMLADDQQDQMDMKPPILGSITIKFIEAFS